MMNMSNTIDVETQERTINDDNAAPSSSSESASASASASATGDDFEGGKVISSQSNHSHHDDDHQQQQNRSFFQRYFWCICVVGTILVGLGIAAAVYFARRPDNIAVTQSQQTETLPTLIKVAPIPSSTTNGAVLIQYTQSLTSPLPPSRRLEPSSSSSSRHHRAHAHRSLSDEADKFYYVELQDLDEGSLTGIDDDISFDDLDLVLTRSSAPTIDDVSKPTSLAISNFGTATFPYRFPDGVLPGDLNGLLLVLNNNGSTDEGTTIAASASFSIIADPSQNIASASTSDTAAPSSAIADEDGNDEDGNTDVGYDQQQPDPASTNPTQAPTPAPTQDPTRQPTVEPTMEPTTAQPSPNPTNNPTPAPTTPFPTSPPVAGPSQPPTPLPSPQPTPNPTSSPTTSPPTRSPTREPTRQPTRQPTREPTPQPTIRTENPTPNPTNRPSASPTMPPLPPVLTATLDGYYDIGGTIRITYTNQFVNGALQVKPRLEFDIPNLSDAPGPYLYLSSRPFSQTDGDDLTNAEKLIRIDEGSDGGSFSISGRFEQDLDEIEISNISDYENGSWVVWCEPFETWIGGGPIRAE